MCARIKNIFDESYIVKITQRRERESQSESECQRVGVGLLGGVLGIRGRLLGVEGLLGCVLVHVRDLEERRKGRALAAARGARAL